MSEKELSSKIGVRKFDGSYSDFRVWKIRVVNALKADKSWIACDAAFSLNETGKKAENANLDEKAKLIIMSTITDNVLRTVYKETAREMWAALCTKYEVKDVQGINFTRRNFFNCKQDDGETVVSFIERVSRLREELEAAEHQMQDIDSIMTIIQGIAPSYEVFVQCLTVNKKATDLNLEEIKNALISEEKRRNEKKNGNQDSEFDQVFYQKEKGNRVKSEQISSVCYNCNKAGHIARNCRFDKNKCYNCNKYGHLSTHCRQPKAENENASANSTHESKKQKEFVFHANTSSNDTETKNVWLLDSGATNHICCEKAMFVSMRAHKSTMKVGDGRELQVTGIGDVELQTENATIKIREVLFVPDMKVNLISIGKITKKGCKILFEKDRCKIMLNRELVVDAEPWTSNNNLYRLQVTQKRAEMALMSCETKVQRHRTGHLNEKKTDKFCENLESVKTVQRERMTLKRTETRSYRAKRGQTRKDRAGEAKTQESESREKGKYEFESVRETRSNHDLSKEKKKFKRRWEAKEKPDPRIKPKRLKTREGCGNTQKKKKKKA